MCSAWQLKELYKQQLIGGRGEDETHTLKTMNSQRTSFSAMGGMERNMGGFSG